MLRTPSRFVFLVTGLLLALSGCIGTVQRSTEEAVQAAVDRSFEGAARVMMMKASGNHAVALISRPRVELSAVFLQRHGHQWAVAAGSEGDPLDVDGLFTLYEGGVSAAEYEVGWVYGRIRSQQVARIRLTWPDGQTEEPERKGDLFLLVRPGVPAVTYQDATALDGHGTRLGRYSPRRD